MPLKINKRQFKQWIAALDSGEYKQGRCSLQGSLGYCCLGVGCAVTIPKELIALDQDGFMLGDMPDSNPAAPEWLKEINKDFREKSNKDLVRLNDTDGFTFPEIATLLELVYVHKMLD